MMLTMQENKDMLDHCMYMFSQSFDHLQMIDELMAVFKVIRDHAVDLVSYFDKHVSK